MTSKSLNRSLASLLMGAIVALLLAFPLGALADELGDVRAEIDAKAGELQKVTDLVKESGDDLAALDEEIASLTEEIKDQQAKRSDLQHRISSISKVMYKNGDQLNLVNIITNAESLSDVLEQVEVRRKVLTEYLSLSEEQQRVDAELQVSYKEVSNQKDEQAKKLADLQSQQDELDEIMASLKGREAELTAAEAAALAAAAEAEANAQAAVQDVVPQPESGDEVSTQAESASAVGTGWSSGAASAYGGSTDDTDDPSVPTATGTYVDDYSMGVAVPMAWGPEDYYGRSVEITYNGRTVVATVTDCGGMNGGERSLDLQPGVWKALGSDSCDDWGVRDVQYRFL